MRSVLAFIKLCNIEFVYEELDVIEGDNYSEEYAKIDPFKEMPAIVHNEFNVWEAASIISYLADAYNTDTQWYPKDIKTRARINSYLHRHHEMTRAPLNNYLIAKIVAPRFYGANDLNEETEAPYKEKIEEWYNTFNWILGETHYVARTANPTIADIFAYNEVFAAISLLGDMEKYTEIGKWYKEIGEIQAVKEYADEAYQIGMKAMMG